MPRLKSPSIAPSPASGIARSTASGIVPLSPWRATIKRLRPARRAQPEPAPAQGIRALRHERLLQSLDGGRDAMRIAESRLPAARRESQSDNAPLSFDGGVA